MPPYSEPLPCPHEQIFYQQWAETMFGDFSLVDSNYRDCFRRGAIMYLRWNSSEKIATIFLAPQLNYLAPRLSYNFNWGA